MRFVLAAMMALVALASATPKRAEAQLSVSLNFGPPQTVLVYDEAYFGPWRTAYVGWEPVRLYVVDGVYYERPVRRARVVMVYRRGHEYFLPPRDVAWVAVDRRFDARYRPVQWDYDHGKRHGNNG